MMIPDYVKAPLSALVLILMNLVQANEVVVFVSGITSLIYIVYKIIEADAKRKYYKKQNQKENESK